MKQQPEKLIGKLVSISDRESNYYRHWGFIVDWDGEVFHVTGGSIALDSNPNITPIFDRDQFTIPRNLDVYRKMGVKLDENGYRIT